MMKFYDALVSCGSYINNTTAIPSVSHEKMLAELARAGVSGAVYFDVMADVSGVAIGNDTLIKQLRTAPEGFYGAYTIVPSCTGETVPPALLPAFMRENRLAALRLNPPAHKYVSHPGVLSDYLSLAGERKIPVYLSTGAGLDLKTIYEFMERFPRLTAILCDHNVWPTDRFFRPFLEKFPNLVMETSAMITDQGFEDVVKTYGPERFLFASDFPRCYIGAQMLNIRHAEISDEAKEKIAGGNLLKLIAEADFS